MGRECEQQATFPWDLGFSGAAAIMMQIIRATDLLKPSQIILFYVSGIS